MVGARFSVRLPRRIVPICVSAPIGFDRPFRIAMMPAMVVVLTAPRPTRRTPSLPSAGAIDRPFDTKKNYIIRVPGFRVPGSEVRVFRLKKSAAPHATAIAMIGAKPGQSVVVLGADGPLAAAIGLVTGLNGRTVVVDRAEDAAARVQTAADDAGALVEFVNAAPDATTCDDSGFDIVV